MDQMEHNVKIKTYKRHDRPRPFLHYVNAVNHTPTYPSYLEQTKMLDRFKEVHWEADQIRMYSYDYKIGMLKEREEVILDNQERERTDVAQHRLKHLQGIKDNIQESRDRFSSRTQLERPDAIEKQLGGNPLYKIVNDAKQGRH